MPEETIPSQAENTLTTSSEPNAEVKKADENLVETTAESLSESVEDLLEIEDDGDIFWLLQRIVWSIVKSILVISVVVFLFWAIWGDEVNLKWLNFSDSGSGTNIPRKIITPEKRTPDDAPLRPTTEYAFSSYRNESVTAVNWNYWLRQRFLDAQSGNLESALVWKRSVDAFFAVSLPDMVSGRDQFARAAKIRQLLFDIDTLQSESEKIRGSLNYEIRNFQNGADDLEFRAKNSETIYTEKIRQGDGNEVRKQIDFIIDQRNQKYSRDVQIWARQEILQFMDRYDASLLNLENNVIQNRAALIKNVRVTDMPGDPFDLIIPSQ